MLEWCRPTRAAGGGVVGVPGGGGVPWPCARHGHRARDRGRRGIRVTREGAQQQHAIGEVERLLDVVRDEEDRGRLGGVDLQEQVVHTQPGEGVECAEGLVEQQHAGVPRQSAREGGTLGHSSRHLARALPCRVLEADEVQQLFDAFASLTPGRPSRESEFDVLGEGPPRQQPRLLEGDCGALVGVGDGRAAELDPAAARSIQTADQSEKSGLATARRADDGDDLTGCDVEGDPAQHLSRPVTERERAPDGVQLHGCRGAGRPRSARRCRRVQEGGHDFMVSEPGRLSRTAS